MSEREKYVLCCSLDFAVFHKFSHESIEAEFEPYWQQYDRKAPNSQEAKLECKAMLADLSQKYASSKVDRTGFPLDTDHLKALNGLKKRHNIVTRLDIDRGTGVVILTHKDSLEKMELILSDETKFKRMGDTKRNNNTLKQERAFQVFLLKA